MHIYKNKFEDEERIDVYTKDGIYHFVGDKFTDDGYREHIFGEVPISICRINIREDDDTIHDDIAKLQDVIVSTYQIFLQKLPNTVLHISRLKKAL